MKTFKAMRWRLRGFISIFHLQVELTWDETDKKRTEMLMRKFDKDDLEKMDMKDYLASSSSDEEGKLYFRFSWINSFKALRPV